LLQAAKAKEEKSMEELDYSRLLRIIQDRGIPHEKPAEGCTMHEVQDGNYTVSFTVSPEKGLMYGDDLRTLQWIFLHAVDRDGVRCSDCRFDSHYAALQEIGLPVAHKNEEWLRGSIGRIFSTWVDVEVPGIVHSFKFVDSMAIFAQRLEKVKLRPMTAFS